MTKRDAQDMQHDDVVVYVLLAAVGLIPVMIAITAGGPFGVDATLGLIMLALGLAGLALLAMHRRGDL